jgi:uncharacterized protein YhbP (UPF0306 family)
MAERRIRTAARKLLDASTLCAIATVAGGRAYVSTAYFAWTADWRLFWLSEPRAKHSRNIRANGSVAVAIFDSHQTWGNLDRGIQLFGSAGKLAGPEAEAAADVYANRFPDHRHSKLGAYRFYEFRPRRLKLFDEVALGAGTFVTARVGRDGRLEWERTEIYDATA